MKNRQAEGPNQPNNTVIYTIIIVVVLAILMMGYFINMNNRIKLAPATTPVTQTATPAPPAAETNTAPNENNAQPNATGNAY
ncbi:MAG: hypothetical protein JO149_01550 [Gammaproteobacteria bacterium]|nr:hypothetical protein [Gammaproteobacteria bacterium]